MFTFNKGVVLELSCCCKMPVLFMNASVHSEDHLVENREVFKELLAPYVIMHLK